MPVDSARRPEYLPEPELARDRQRSRRMWCAALIGFVLTIALPLLAIAEMTDEPPEVRVLQTDGRVSSLIADGAVRILVLNTTDPRTALSALGEARPWEPAPQVIIAPSDNEAAVGLLAVIRAANPQAVIVAGLPGANLEWHLLERECRERGIDLEFTVGNMRIAGESLSVTVSGVGTDMDVGRVVVVRRDDNGATLALALDRGVPDVSAHALVTTGKAEAAQAVLTITTSDEPRRVTHAEVALGFRERARIVLARGGIEIFGGTFRAASNVEGN